MVPEQRAMAHRDRADLRQALHALQRLQHAAGVGTHQAVVIKAKIRSDRAGIAVIQGLGAIVQPKSIAGVENPCAVIKGEDRVRPMQIRGGKKVKAMSCPRVGVGAQIQAVASFHRPAPEGPMDLVLQKLERHLGRHNFQIGMAFQQVTNQARMIRLRVRHDQHVDRLRINQSLQ
jgi:hypothetical protein